MPLKVANNAFNTLSTPCGAGDTSITVVNAASFPDLSGLDDFTYLTLISKVDGSLELVKATDITGNVITVVRAQGTTSALAFGIDTRVELRLCAEIFDWMINDKEFRFFSYTGTPTAAGTLLDTAQDGDLFMDLSNADLYQRNAGVWGVAFGNIKGVQGEPGFRWFLGADNPNTTPPTGSPLDGDLYLQVNGDVWVLSGTWSTIGINLKGANGAGSGDVLGAGPSTVDNLVLFGNATGDTLKESGKSIANVSFVNEAETRSAAIDLANNQLKQAELKDWSETTTTSATSGAVTLDCALGNVFSATLTGDVTSISLINPPQTGKSGTVVWIVTQNATTAKTIALPTGSVWASGTTADFSTLGAVYILTFKTIDGGTSWVVASAGGGGGLSGLSAGGLLFGGSDGKATQDANKLTWDNTNKRMGVNTATPSGILSVAPPVGTFYDITAEASGVSGVGSVATYTDSNNGTYGTAIVGQNFGITFNNPRYIKGIDYYGVVSGNYYVPRNCRVEVTYDGSAWVQVPITAYSGKIQSVTDDISYDSDYLTPGWGYLSISPVVAKGIRLYQTAIWGNAALVSELKVWGTALTYANIASQAAGVVTTGSVTTYTDGDPTVAVGTQFTNGSFGLYFSATKTVNKIRFASRGGVSAPMPPKRWRADWSNNGTDWTTIEILSFSENIASVTANVATYINYTNNPVWHTIEFDPVSAIYFRIFIVEDMNGNPANVSELQIFGVSDFNPYLLEVTSAGRTGFGTTSPQAKIDIHNTGDFQSLRVYRAGVTVTDYIATWQSDAPGGVGTIKAAIRNDGQFVGQTATVATFSDVKLKENITDLPPQLDKLLQTRVRNFNLIGDTLKQAGWIAQELEQIYPGLVEDNPDFEMIPDANWIPQEGQAESERPMIKHDLGTFTKSVKFTIFIPLTVKGLQELYYRHLALEARVAALETLEARVAALEAV